MDRRGGRTNDENTDTLFFLPLMSYTHGITTTTTITNYYYYYYYYYYHTTCSSLPFGWLVTHLRKGQVISP